MTNLTDEEDGAPTVAEVARIIRSYRDGLRHGRRIAVRLGAAEVVREIDAALDRGAGKLNGQKQGQSETDPENT